MELSIVSAQLITSSITTLKLILELHEIVFGLFTSVWNKEAIVWAFELGIYEALTYNHADCNPLGTIDSSTIVKYLILDQFKLMTGHESTMQWRRHMMDDT